MSHAVLFACLSAATPQAPAAPAPAPAPVPVVVRGVVLDSELRPAAGIALALLDDEALGGADDVAAALAQPLARTAADGAFELQVTLPPKGSRWLVIGGGHWATMMHELSGWRGKPAVHDLGAFALAPGTSGAGRVRDAKGEPVEGAQVEVLDLLDSRTFMANRGSAQVKCRTLARSDARGIFRLSGMVQSAGRLRVRKDGCYDEQLQPVGIGEPLDVTLFPAPTIRGRVLDADGKPVARAWVYAGSNSAKTDAEGRFACALSERGVDSARTSAQIGGRWQSAEQKLPVDGSDVELRLPGSAEDDGKAVRVVARGPDGAAVPAFTAYVSWNRDDQLQYRPDALLLARWAQGQGDWTAATVDGAVDVRGGQRDGDAALVFVRAEGFAWGRVEADSKVLGAEPVVVPLQQQAVLRGRVLDAVSGAGLAGARVLATQRLSDRERGFYGRGFRTVASFADALSGTTTGADGSYELRGVMPGKGDLFVHVDGRIELPPVQFEIAAGETRGDVDFRLPPDVVLRATIDGPLPAGAQVRVHWHRPNMSSSAWPGEYDGAVPVARDGAFAIEGLHPKPYEMQLLCAAPPRGGPRLKLAVGIWDGASPPPEPPKLASAGPVQLTGKVGTADGAGGSTTDSTVPWQRLAVAALWQAQPNSFRGDYGIDGPVALLRPDRGFLLLAARQRVHLLLFDVLTGIALEWQEIDLAGEPPAAVQFAGTATEQLVTLVPGKDSAPPGTPCTVLYEPDDEHWPAGVGNLVPSRFGARNGRGGMATDARVGETLRCWLPARTGTLRVKRGNDELRAVDLGQLPGGPVTIELGSAR